MADFDASLVAGKDYLLPIAENALVEFKLALRAYDGELYQQRLEAALPAMRQELKEIAGTVYSLEGAIVLGAEGLIFDVGFRANGISPLRVNRPPRFGSTNPR